MDGYLPVSRVKVYFDQIVGMLDDKHRIATAADGKGEGAGNCIAFSIGYA